MSSGGGCKVKEHRSHWVVTARNCNFSAFNGYHRTYSEYSQVECLHPDHRGTSPLGPLGGTLWRTKAKYVDDLPDAGGAR